MIHFQGFSALWCNFPFRVAKRMWSFLVKSCAHDDDEDDDKMKGQIFQSEW